MVAAGIVRADVDLLILAQKCGMMAGRNELNNIHAALNRILPLGEDEWNDLAGGLILKDFYKGEYLIREGQVENYIYFLNRGSTRNYFIKEGKEFTVDFHFEGEFVTAYYSFITREPSGIFIELLEDTETVVIPYGPLQAFYNKYHNGEKVGRLIAEYQYVKRLRKEMELLSLTAEERYTKLMQKNPALINSISVKHLSSYLGIQPESLSRIRKLHMRN
jgi:CRP/FNR family transcriptional regulator, anaerobic regulatory protein